MLVRRAETAKPSRAAAGWWASRPRPLAQRILRSRRRRHGLARPVVQVVASSHAHHVSPAWILPTLLGASGGATRLTRRELLKNMGSVRQRS